MEELKEINKSLIDEYISLFMSKEKDNEETLKMIFRDYKNNGDIRNVTTKTIVLDTIYSTGIRYVDRPYVIQHIVDCHKEIDDLLASRKREYELFDIIANIPVEGVFHQYVFASKYLSFSNQELYPIMDSYSRNFLNQYSEIDPTIPKIKGTEDYRSFCAAFDTFHKLVNKSTQNEYTPKEIDMFIWQYAKDNMIAKSDN